MYVVIAGGGKVGKYLANVLLSNGNEVVVIESDPEKVERLAKDLSGQFMVISGDGCNSKYQEDAGIRNADVFVAATGKDENNLVACEIAHRVFNVPRHVARVNEPANHRIFRSLGIECVSATELIASLIEEETIMASMGILSTMTDGDIALSEVTLRSFKKSSSLEGVLLSDIEFPEGSLAVSVTDENGARIVDASTRVYPGNKIMIAANTGLVDKARACLINL